MGIKQKTNCEVIFNRFIQGASTKELVKEFGLSLGRISYIVNKEKKKRGLHTVSKSSQDRKKIIVELYNGGKSFREIGKVFNMHHLSIKRILKEEKIKLRIEKSSHKGEFNEVDKKEIVRLYVKEKRGASYIGKLFNRSDFGIVYYLRKWGIPIWDRKTISKQIRDIYGPTKGFTGREHSQQSKEKTSDSGKLAWQSESREPRGGYSKTYNTIIGKVIGTYEVAFLQKLINENKPLPKAEVKKIKTPFGMYTPDFEFEDKLIEIKSCFTIKVCKGEMAFVNQQRCDKQWKKIEWVRQNIKPVEIMILDNKEAITLFKQAKEEKLLLIN